LATVPGKLLRPGPATAAPMHTVVAGMQSALHTASSEAPKPGVATTRQKPSVHLTGALHAPLASQVSTKSPGPASASPPERRWRPGAPPPPQRAGGAPDPDGKSKQAPLFGQALGALHTPLTQRSRPLPPAQRWLPATHSIWQAPGVTPLTGAPAL